MADPPRKKKPAPRSRSGCLPCRQHHRRCDQARPACGLCREKKRACRYGLRIAWGGRPFARSSFGRCVASAAVVRVEVEEGGRQDGRGDQTSASFVYGVAASAGTASRPASQQSSPDQTDDSTPSRTKELTSAQNEASQETTTSSIAKLPPLLPNLPPAHRPLLDYFPLVADSFSCSAAVKTQFLATFVPIAVQTPHAMAALLSLAATHRLSSGHAQSEAQRTVLQTAAVEQLRLELASAPQEEAALASIMLLCYAEVVAGSDRSRSWRHHLEGAAALMGNHQPVWAATTASSQDPARAFLARCFVSLAALASVSARPPSDAVSRRAVELASAGGDAGRIDDFTAFSSGLVPVLVEIGSLLGRRGSNPAPGAVISQEHASSLVRRIRNSMRREYVGIGASTSPTLPHAREMEYLNINESYHEAALIQVHQRLRGLPPSSPEVRRSVRRILTLLADVQMLNGSCPAIVLLFPLFSAGCGATGAEDRAQVRMLLTGMVERFRLGTVRHGLEVLEAIWSHGDACAEPQVALDWERLIGPDIDLILY